MLDDFSENDSPFPTGLADVAVLSDPEAFAMTLSPDVDTDEAIDEREASRRQFAEEFGLTWEAIGSPRMDGRIIGYLMIMKLPFISSADLGRVLNASAGSVSMATRRLVDSGFVKRHVVAGDRNHYFKAESDIWGSWLAGERRYLDQERAIIQRGIDMLDQQPEAGEADARRRLLNGRDYMTWLAGYHRKMLIDWEAFKAERDGAAGGSA